MKKIINFGLLLVLTIATLLSVYSAFTPFPDQDSSLKEDTIQFSENWCYTDENGIKQFFSFPHKIHFDSDNTSFVFTKKLPANLPKDAILTFKTNHYSVRAYRNGDEIPVEGSYRNRTFGVRYTATWVAIPLEETDANQEITVKIGENSKKSTTTIGEIVLINQNTFTHIRLRESVPNSFFFISMLLLAIFLFILGIIGKKKSAGFRSRALLYLALFILLATIWMITDSEILFLFFGYKDAFYFVSFFSFMLLPIPFLLFVREAIPINKRVIPVLIIAFLLSFLLAIAFLLGGVLSSLPPILLPTHVLLVISLVILFILSVFDAIRHKNRAIREIIGGMLLFFIASSLSLVFFYSNTPSGYALTFRFGLFAFIVFLATGTIRQSLSVIRKASSFEELTQTIPCGICKVKRDDNLTILYANDFYYDMFGYTAESAKAVGFTFGKFIVVEEDIAAVSRTMKENIEKKNPYFELETRQRHQSGTILYTLVRCNYVAFSNELIASILNITDRKQMEQELRIREEEYRIAAQHSEKYILRYDIATKTVYNQSDAAGILYAMKVIKNVPESVVESGIIAPESVREYCNFYTSIQNGEKNGTTTCCIKNKAGKYTWYRADFTNVYDDNGKAIHAIVSFYDVSELREMALSYEKWKQTIADMPQEKICMIEHNLTKNILSNTKGYLLKEILENISEKIDERVDFFAHNLVYIEDISSFVATLKRERLIESYQMGKKEENITIRMLLNDEYRWISISIQMVAYSDSNDIQLFLLFRDIQEEQLQKLWLQERSSTDSLTGVFNRTAFTEHLELLLKQNTNQKHALVMLDVDYFKTINDTFGHCHGDKVLIDLVASLHKILHADDFLGRIGGDEFIFCLKDIDDENALQKRMEEIRQSLQIPVSMGIAIFTEDAKSFRELYEKADIALYRAKELGRNQFVLYTPAMKDGQRHITLADMKVK